ncbi:MAG: proteasome accessory factor PafA2 family protein [Deferrisomatales bacterium]|nr:proteasome accessory factor PafA2 family protein [Deferrisomatales bacterium]
MSLPKIVGLEQEYALKLRSPDERAAFHTSCLLVNAYARSIGLREPGLHMVWDYGHETPYQDIRGKIFRSATGQEVMGEDENRLINAPLPNGARLYTDHAHPEYSTPECRSARDAVACEKAGEVILLRALQLATGDLPDPETGLFKNNTDHQGHSYGSHENYLMEARAHDEWLAGSPERAAKTLIPFLVTRQLLAGAGKVGGEREGKGVAGYQVSQRADFVEAVFGLATTHSRALINTRSEHHADPRRFRRLHLILGDANLCEVANFLKIGTTQIVLRMLEDEALPGDWSLRDPVDAVQRVSRHWDDPVELADGRTVTALDVQRHFLAVARGYVAGGGLQEDPEGEEVLELWETVLSGLEHLELSAELEILADPGGLARQLDWVLKLWLLNRYRQAKAVGWDHPYLKTLDLQYHNIHRGQGLFYHLQDRGLVDRIVDDDEIARFVTEPPADTRAWFRGRCIRQFPEALRLVNWEVVGFAQGTVHRVVPLLNPLKGTRVQFEAVFKRCGSAAELLAAVSAG